MTAAPPKEPLNIAMIAGEASGDHLGGPLMSALRDRLGHDTAFFGVGGSSMEREGLQSLFPMSDIAVMGPIAILRQIRFLRRRILQTVEAIVDAKPDGMVIIDCPEFSHRVAARVRARLPDLPVVDYVAPTVWAWRSGRARKMLGYVDAVLAILPFEPAEFERLGGPECHYVGHPAIERGAPEPSMLSGLRARFERQVDRVLVVMPGSRRTEIKRLLEPFADAVAHLAGDGRSLGVIVPTLPHLVSELSDQTANWASRPVIVATPEERHAAMVLADAALAASGTATLELALTRTPMVVGYRMERLFAWSRHVFLPVHSIVMANLIHGGHAVPEMYQGRCNGPELAATLRPLLDDTPERRTQLEALDLIIEKTRAAGDEPSARAADIVVSTFLRRPVVQQGQRYVPV